MDPAVAYGEYIGATLIEPAAAVPLADALETTWRRDPGSYYEDGYQELADRGGEIAAAPIGDVDWVEVDDHTRPAPGPGESPVTVSKHRLLLVSRACRSWPACSPRR